MTEKQPTTAEVLNARRVRWKFNHDRDWQYGRPISYTDQPSYIVERESDGLRVGVLASFNPHPVPADELFGDVPENWDQIVELAKVLNTAAGLGTPVGVTEIAQAEAALKHLAADRAANPTADAARALDALPRDSVIMVENEGTRHRWLAWRSTAGDWDVISPRGEADRMTSTKLAGLGAWQLLQTTGPTATRSVHDARGSREDALLRVP
ncbi:hypothetical protein [Curtobacterium sp. DN_7.5]|uniref:hypothetical protein n=1 Tax=Curtobacterium sp. DN_7.5 TaxID=3049047 RepID=UPI001F5A91AC|nr:hypothetical protein [Curtobacterium sp. DN_7.5]